MTRPIEAPAEPLVIVCTGPGQLELLPARAVRALALAEVVIGASGDLAFAGPLIGPSAEVVLTDDPAEPQAGLALARTAVRWVREGRRVVRIAPGDPLLDGSLGVEIGAYRRGHVELDIVAAASPLTSIPGHAGIPVLHRPGRLVGVVVHPGAGEWTAFADDRTSLLALTDEPARIAAELIRDGRSGQTPAAFIRHGATIDQQVLLAELATIGAVVAEAAGPAASPGVPAVSGEGMLIVGEPVTQRERHAWFDSRALFGWRVLLPLTREAPRAIIEGLLSHGARTVTVPTLSVEPPRTPAQMDRAMSGIESGRYRWMVFTSANAVRAVRQRFDDYGWDVRTLAGLRIAAVDDETVAELRDFGVRPDLVPAEDQSSSGLLAAFPHFGDDANPLNRIFLPRADIATDTLVGGLRERGWDVEDLTAFRTVRAAPPPAQVREAIKTGGFDAVLFTSASTVRNLVGLAGKPHPTTVVGVIGPQTAQAAEEHGLRVDLHAEEPTPAALVAALVAHGVGLREQVTPSGLAPTGSWRPGARARAALRRPASG